MNSMTVRTIHRGLGISIVCFLIVQATVGMLMSIGKLASLDTAPSYNVLYSIHAGWDPIGNVYRVLLGLSTAIQGILGIMIFSDWHRHRTGKHAILSPDQSREPKKEATMSSSSFVADIRPLFRDKDVRAMKPYMIDLSSYEEVKQHAQDIYDRLSAGDMPCDAPWSESDVRKFLQWMQGGMNP